MKGVGGRRKREQEVGERSGGGDKGEFYFISANIRISPRDADGSLL